MHFIVIFAEPCQDDPSTITKTNLGRVRLTLFRNKNRWSDDENDMFGAFRSIKDNKDMFKIAF